MIEESDVLVGTTQSTFSFAAHARGLIQAFYPSFRMERSTACGKPVDTEGGLLAYGLSYDQCHFNGITREITCTRLQPECLQFVMAWSLAGKCIQHVGTCLGSDISWAKPYLLDIDLTASQNNMAAKNYFHFEAHSTVKHFSSCILRTSQKNTHAWAQFKLFQKVVCSKCASRGFQCGCELGLENPAFQPLHDFVEEMETARQSNYNTPIKWIVINIMGGLGMHQIQLVFSMMKC
jgi:hypothetical protein